MKRGRAPSRTTKKAEAVCFICERPGSEERPLMVEKNADLGELRVHFLCRREWQRLADALDAFDTSDERAPGVYLAVVRAARDLLHLHDVEAPRRTIRRRP